MRPSILLRASACLALCAFLAACGSAAVPTPHAASNVPAVHAQDNPQDPNK